MILRSCGADAKDIVENYHQSEILLEPVMGRIIKEDRDKGLDAGFDGTPEEVMRETIKFISSNWGTLSKYLVSIGFTLEEQEKLVSCLSSMNEEERTRAASRNYTKQDYELEQSAAFTKFLWQEDEKEPKTEGLKLSRLAPSIEKQKTKAKEKKIKSQRKMLKEIKKLQKKEIRDSQEVGEKKSKPKRGRKRKKLKRILSFQHRKKEDNEDGGEGKLKREKKQVRFSDQDYRRNDDEMGSESEETESESESSDNETDSGTVFLFSFPSSLFPTISLPSPSLSLSLSLSLECCTLYGISEPHGTSSPRPRRPVPLSISLFLSLFGFVMCPCFLSLLSLLSLSG